MNPELLTQAFGISAVAMTIVFGVLLLLWGFMAVLVRVTAEHAPIAAMAVTGTVLGDSIGADEKAAERVRRVQAAAAAVAVALALEQDQETNRTVPPPISPWQATLRGSVLSRRASAFRRQPPPPRR